MNDWDHWHDPDDLPKPNERLLWWLDLLYRLGMALLFVVLLLMC